MEYAQKQGYKSEVIEEIASGLNENRHGLEKLIKMVFAGKVERVIVEWKDRLARFGYKYLYWICQHNNVEVIILNQKDEKKYEEELAEDVIAVVGSFSARLYGSRGGRKKKICVPS